MEDAIKRLMKSNDSLLREVIHLRDEIHDISKEYHQRWIKVAELAQENGHGEIVGKYLDMLKFKGK